MLTTDEIALSEHIFEIRYSNDARVLDHLGDWTERVKTEMALVGWQIGLDRTDIGSNTDAERCFVTHGNAGYIVKHPESATLFPDRAAKFARCLMDRLPGFPEPLYVARLGVRSRFCLRTQCAFPDLLERVKERYISPTDTALQVIGGELVDIGAPLNFTDDHGSFNTLCGPMKVDQLRQFFKDHEESQFPEVGLYYDIDYWVKPDSTMESKTVSRRIDVFARESWARCERIADLILGDKHDNGTRQQSP